MTGGIALVPASICDDGESLPESCRQEFLWRGTAVSRFRRFMRWTLCGGDVLGWIGGDQCLCFKEVAIAAASARN